MPYKINPKKKPSKARVKWEKAKKAIGTTLKGSLGGAGTGALAGLGLAGPAGLLPGAVVGGTIGQGAGAYQAYQQNKGQDAFGNPSNIQAELVGVNPNATRHNENIDISQLNPEARAEWEKEQQKPSWTDILQKIAVGEESKPERIDVLSPEQRQLFNQQVLPYILNQIGQSGKSLQEYGQEFEPFAQEARQNFNQVTIPTISQRFGALGRTPTGSGAFRNALQDTAQNFDTQLKSHQAQFALQNRQNQQQNTLGLLGQGLGRQYDTRFTNPNEGLLQPLLGSAGKLGLLKLFGAL